MIKYTEKLKEAFRTCRNPQKDFGVSYNVMWNILDDKEIAMKTLLKIMDQTHFGLEDCIYYED